MLSLFWGYSPQTLGRALNALHPHLWTRLQILSNNFPMMIVCIDVNLCEKGDAFEKYPPNVGRGLAPAAVWKYICMQMSATLLLNIRYRTCLSADPCFSSCRRKTLPSSMKALSRYICSRASFEEGGALRQRIGRSQFALYVHVGGRGCVFTQRGRKTGSRGWLSPCRGNGGGQPPMIPICEKGNTPSPCMMQVTGCILHRLD